MVLCLKHILQLSAAWLLVLHVSGTRAQFKPRRCYTCRSRGERGDCRDTFIRPSSVLLDTAGLDSEEAAAVYRPVVDETPCATGWCAKIIEGVGVGSVISEDYGVATERQCMTRAPSDNKERCAYVVYRGKQVFMCFCKGDLCNTGSRAGAAMSPVLLAAALISSLAVAGLVL